MHHGATRVKYPAVLGVGMAREVESAHQFTSKSHKFGLEKERTVIRCDDGAVYEFVRATDTTIHRLSRRFKPDGTVSTSSARLPGAVKKLADDMFEYWNK